MSDNHSLPYPSLLDKIYTGQFFPPQAFRPACEEYDDLTRRISEDTRYWRNTLSDADFSRLEIRDDLYITSMGFELQAAFQHGFALGTYALLESLDAARHLLSLEP